MKMTRRTTTRTPSQQTDAASLIGAYVTARVFDGAQYANDLYTGMILDERFSRGMWWVLFKSDALVGQKWLPMTYLKGRAQYVLTAQKTAA